MTSWKWNQRAASLVVTLLAVSMFSACVDPGTTAGQNARADIRVTLSQELASSADVARISVSVAGPGIATPIVGELVRNGPAWEGTIQDIPAGPDRSFTATAYDAGSVPIYMGRAGPIAIASGSVVGVAILLQPVNPPVPFENVAPIIESLVASSNPVQPGGTITLTARAVDPNPGDTLGYTWSAPAGSFGSPNSMTTSWTAPATEGVTRILLEVKDSRMASSTMSLDVYVQNPGSVGGAKVSTSFNSWPSIAFMTGAPSPVEPGVPTQLFVSATDTDGDALSFSWNSSCPGSFDNPTLPQPLFTLTTQAPGGSCVFRVAVSDGRGGQHTGSLTLHIRGGAPTPNQPPLLVSAYSSATEAGGSELITLGLQARDPEGMPLRFSWLPTVGLIRAERLTDTSSEIDWQAPTCLDAPALLTAIVQDANGATVSHTFSISPRPGTQCGSTGVSGVRNVIYVVDEVERRVVPDDLSFLTIGAWVPTADGSGYEYRPGTGRSDGTFSIPDVQRTPYLLQLGNSYQWTGSREHSLRRILMGRPDVQPMPEGSMLDLQISGLTPWRADNDVQFHAPAVGLAYFSAASCAVPSFPAQEGDTFIFGSLDFYASLSACGNTPNSRDLSRGDVLYVTHLESRVNPGTDAILQEVRQAFQTTGSGNFITLASVPTVRQSVDFRSSEFEALALAAHPNATLNTNNLNIGTMQGYNEFGTYGSWPDLALSFDTTPGQGDSFTMFEYGDPYPSQWARMLNAAATSTVSYSVPLPDGSTSAPRTITVTVSSREPLRPGMVHLVRPQVGPPQELRINGLPATTSLSGVGPSPLVTWKAPALGVANRYMVRVYRFTATSTGSTSRVLVATINTTEPQLRLTPNLLGTGNSVYALQVYAYSEQSNATTSHYASALTSGFTP